MKRCLSIVLTLTLFAALLFPALAEEEIVCEAVDAQVAPAEMAGDTGLTVEAEGDVPTQEQAGDVPSASADGPDGGNQEISAGLLPEEADDGDEGPSADEDGEGALADEGGFEVAAAPALTGLKLSAKTLSIGLNEKYTGLTVSALPSGSALPAVTWSSGNTRYVRVNASTGAITGVRRGSAYVTAKTKDGKYKVRCKVTVRKKPGKISVSPSSLTLSVGMTAHLDTALPRGTASGALTFSSSRPKKVSVDANGVVTALKKGSATITVSTYNGRTARCKVTVKAAPAAVTFSDPAVCVAAGQSATLKVEALTASGEAVPATVAYAVDAASSDAGCVTLDAGKGTVTGASKGRAVITATTHNGLVARCEVVVASPPASVRLNSAGIRIGVKELYTGLAAETAPPAGEQVCAGSVTWSSSNKKVATVDSRTGAVTGVRRGTCTVTARTFNGLKAECTVRVVKAPGSVSIKPVNGVLRVGRTGQYKISFPKGCGGGITYQSSNTDIATIDASGLVTAVAPGVVTITVTTYNGKTAKASLTVNSDGIAEDSDGGKSGTNAEKIDYLVRIAMTQLGKPYIYGGGYKGGDNPNGFDCSGFTYWCYLHLDIKLKDSAYKQGYDDSLPKIDMGSLKKGDLVYFNTNDKDDDLSDHAGLYLGEGKFIHASSSAGKVILSTLSSGYYNRTFSWGRRVLR